MNADDIAVIILAAGQSTRFGSSKMRYGLPNGKSVLQTTIEQYQANFSNVSVVISVDDEQLIKSQTEDVQLVLNKYPDAGMSQSILVGVRAQINAKAWLIALGDMPYVQSTTLKKCAEKASKSTIVVPVCDSRQGNPVIFGADFIDKGLIDLKGDVGAKAMIKDNPNSVVLVETDDKGVLHDIDRPEDVLMGITC